MGNILSCFGFSKAIETRKQKQMEKHQETIENSMTEYNKKYTDSFSQLEDLFNQKDKLLLCSLIVRNQTKKTELKAFVDNHDAYRKTSINNSFIGAEKENKSNHEEDSVSISEEDTKNKLKNKKSKQRVSAIKGKIISPQNNQQISEPPDSLVIGGKSYTVEEIRSCLESVSKNSRTSIAMLTNKHRSLMIQIKHKEREVENISKRMDALFSEHQAITGGREMVEYGGVLERSNKVLKNNLAQISQSNIQNISDESRAVIETFNEVSSSLSTINPKEEESLEDELRQFEQESIAMGEPDSTQSEPNSLFAQILDERLEDGSRIFTQGPVYSIDSEEQDDDVNSPMIATVKKVSNNKKTATKNKNNEQYRQMVAL